MNEQQRAQARVESKRYSWGAGNISLPILREAPFNTSVKEGDIVDFRYIVAGGERPLYFNDFGWEVVGFRHDPKTSRQGLVVVNKGDRTINISLHDIIDIRKAA
jgi:hypothetical protein